MPGWLLVFSGEHLPGAPDRPNLVRNALELVSFASGAGVVVTALAALGFARTQVREAARQNRIAATAAQDTARAAKAEVYQQLFTQLMSADVEAGIDVCAKLNEAWQQSGRALALPAFVCERMDDTRPGEGMAETDRRAALRLLSIIEKFGLLVRLDLFELDEVFFTFEGVLNTVRAVFEAYMRRNRALSGGRESEHALWLLDALAAYTPTQALKD